MPEQTLPAVVDSDCVVCQHPAREVVEQFLFIGYQYHEIPEEIGEPPEFRLAIRAHHIQRHIREVSREAYLMMLVRYTQDTRKLERRELEKSPERQNESRLKRCDDGRRWAIGMVARLEGYDRPQKGAPTSVKSLLEKIANEQPSLAHRITKAVNPPVVTTAEKVE